MLTSSQFSVTSDIIDKIIETDINSQIKDRVKKSYLLRITRISVVCSGCRCVDLVITLVTTQRSPKSEFGGASYGPKIKDGALTDMFFTKPVSVARASDRLRGFTT